LKFLDDFRVLASPQIGCGDSALFWLDKWNGQPLSLSLSLSLAAPELFSFASNRLITIQKAFSSGDFASLLQLPISQVAFAQMEEIQAVMLSRPLDEDNDKWVYEWGSSAFASSKIYRR